RTLRVVLDRFDELLIVYSEALHVICRLDRGGTRSGVNQTHFAKHFARRQRADGPGLRAMTDGDLDRSSDDEECGITLVALGNDRVSGFVRDGLHECASLKHARDRDTIAAEAIAPGGIVI